MNLKGTPVQHTSILLRWEDDTPNPIPSLPPYSLIHIANPSMFRTDSGWTMSMSPHVRGQDPRLNATGFEWILFTPTTPNYDPLSIGSTLFQIIAYDFDPAWVKYDRAITYLDRYSIVEVLPDELLPMFSYLKFKTHLWNIALCEKKE